MVAELGGVMFSFSFDCLSFSLLPPLEDFGLDRNAERLVDDFDFFGFLVLSDSRTRGSVGCSTGLSATGLELLTQSRILSVLYFSSSYTSIDLRGEDRVLSQFWLSSFKGSLACGWSEGNIGRAFEGSIDSGLMFSDFLDDNAKPLEGLRLWFRGIMAFKTDEVDLLCWWPLIWGPAGVDATMMKVLWLGDKKLFYALKVGCTPSIARWCCVMSDARKNSGTIRRHGVLRDHNKTMINHSEYLRSKHSEAIISILAMVVDVSTFRWWLKYLLGPKCSLVRGILRLAG